jgi:hypothetical protein
MQLPTAISVPNYLDPERGTSQRFEIDRFIERNRRRDAIAKTSSTSSMERSPLCIFFA